MFLNGVGVGVLSPTTDGSVGAFFIYFSQISMFLNGVGVGFFVTNDRRTRGGVYYLFFTNFDVFERAWAWVVLSPMTDGSVGAFFYLFFTNFDVFERGGRGVFCHQ